jgi:hypothetical protein
MSCRLGACYAVLDHTHSSGSMLLTAQFSTLCCDPQLATNAQSVDTVCHGKQSALLLIVCACVDNAVQHGFGTCTDQQPPAPIRFHDPAMDCSRARTMPS